MRLGVLMLRWAMAVFRAEMKTPAWERALGMMLISWSFVTDISIYLLFSCEEALVTFQKSAFEPVRLNRAIPGFRKVGG